MLKEIVAEVGVFEAMRRMTETGFSVTEVSQIPMTAENVAGLVRARDELGVEIAAISAGLAPMAGGNDALSTDFAKIVDDAHALGTSMLRVAMLPLGALTDRGQLLDAAALLEDYAERLKAEGLRLIYHNHHVEFARFEGEFIHDILARTAPSVGFELDVHWLQRAGLDPADAIAERAGRVALIHMKDYRVKPLAPEALDSIAQGDMAAFWEAFLGTISDAEVGEGNLNWSRIIPASLDAGAEYLIVEQEQLTGLDVLECLRTSHRNIATLGFGALL